VRLYRLDTIGSVNGLVAHEEPTPIPGPGEVLVRVKASAQLPRSRHNHGSIAVPGAERCDSDVRCDRRSGRRRRWELPASLRNREGVSTPSAAAVGVHGTDLTFG
jgi:hypothetical protein